MTKGDAVGKLSSSASTPKSGNFSSSEPAPKNLATRDRLAMMDVVLKIILGQQQLVWMVSNCVGLNSPQIFSQVLLIFK